MDKFFSEYIIMLFVLTPKEKDNDFLVKEILLAYFYGPISKN